MSGARNSKTVNSVHKRSTTLRGQGRRERGEGLIREEKSGFGAGTIQRAGELGGTKNGTQERGGRDYTRTHRKQTQSVKNI